MKPNSMPDLEADNPSIAASLETLSALLTRAATSCSMLATLVAASEQREAAISDSDTLDADQIAAILSVKRAWLFRNAAKLPFLRRVSRKALAATRGDVIAWRESRRQA